MDRYLFFSFTHYKHNKVKYIVPKKEFTLLHNDYPYGKNICQSVNSNSNLQNVPICILFGSECLTL